MTMTSTVLCGGHCWCEGSVEPGQVSGRWNGQNQYEDFGVTGSPAAAMMRMQSGGTAAR